MSVVVSDQDIVRFKNTQCRKLNKSFFFNKQVARSMLVLMRTCKKPHTSYESVSISRAFPWDTEETVRFKGVSVKRGLTGILQKTGY